MELEVKMLKWGEVEREPQVAGELGNFHVNPRISCILRHILSMTAAGVSSCPANGILGGIDTGTVVLYSGPDSPK